MRKKIIICGCFLFFPLLYIQGHGLTQDVVQKAVMIIARNNFRDEEFLVPKKMLEANNIKVVVASSSLSPSRGMLGAKALPDILIKDIRAEAYDAVIFVGGSGAKEFWDDPVAHNIAVQAKVAEKVIGAICIAPVTLAKAGVLKGKKATVWPGVSRELEAYGVSYTGNDLEIDENIITADGPQAAEKFAAALVNALVRRR